MNSVIFDPSRFKNDLLEASKKNDYAELETILKIINENVYNSHVDLSRHIMMLVNEFEPMDKESTIQYIFDHLSSENKELLDAVNVIKHHGNFKQQRKLLSGCFS